MDNKQEQDMDLDKLLGSTQEDTKIDFGDSQVSDLDNFMQEEPVMEFSPLVEEKPLIEDEFVDESENMDPVADFTDFKMEDLDSALKSFQEARKGRVSSVKENTPQIDERQPDVMDSENVVDTDVVLPEVQENVSEQYVEAEPEPRPEETESLSKDDSVEGEQYEEANSQPRRPNINPMVIEEKDLKLQGISEKSEEVLRWYSGKFDDKTYEISVDNMPEFLDMDKTIRVIHVSVASPYGWNVFFDNGIFMNLQDLQVYQTRHGKMPYHSGKIVYANKSTQFENINRIVVYQLPRYFTYKPE